MTSTKDDSNNNKKTTTKAVDDKKTKTGDTKRSSTSRKTTARKTTNKKASKTTSRSTQSRKSKASTNKTSTSKGGVIKSKAKQLALLPYRVPMDVDKMGMQVARVGGFAFILFGLIFTYNFLEEETVAITEKALHTANVTAASGCGENCAQTTNPKTPKVEFAYRDGSSDNEKQIFIRTKKAETVTLYAYDVDKGEYQKLGDANKVDDDIWSYQWNIDNVEPGKYWIKALVSNSYGMYDRSDSDYLEI